MSREVYSKIMHFVHKSPVEISGLGKVVVEADGTLRVTNVMLLPQKNTAASTDIEAADVAKAMYQTREAPGELRFWWHSHVNMNAFWSGTDFATIKSLASGGWFISTVFNKKAESKTCVAFATPFEGIIDDVTLNIVDEVSAETLKQWDAEYVANVKETPTYVQGFGSTFASSLTYDSSARFPRTPTQYTGNVNPLYGIDNDSEKDDSFVFSQEIVANARKKLQSKSVHSIQQKEVQEALDKREMLEAQLEIIDEEIELYETLGLVVNEEVQGV
jgi:hypothetical protein